MRGDGLRPPGVGTGVLCHANEVPFFNVAITNFRVSFMAANQSGDTARTPAKQAKAGAVPLSSDLKVCKFEPVPFD